MKLRKICLEPPAQPSLEHTAEIAVAIERFDDDDFDVREHAFRVLSAGNQHARRQLEAVENSDNVQIAASARKILKKWKLYDPIRDAVRQELQNAEAASERLPDATSSSQK